MNPGLVPVYVAGWGLACLVAAVLVLRAPRSFAFTRRGYWQHLGEPWKLASFAVAVGFFVVVAPYSGDPTWDQVDALFMSVLTYLTAPWAVGALYRVARHRLEARQGLVAAALWLLSASWSYDAYLLVRDGRYPATWGSNLVASSVIYCAAGLLFSLGHFPDRGVVFGFMRDDWPRAAPGRPMRVVGYAVVFVLLVVAMLQPFWWGVWRQ